MTQLSDTLTLPCGAMLKNRIGKSAMSEALGTWDNHPTHKLDTLYRRWADGGTGLVITGNVMIDRRALGEPNNVAIEDETDLATLQRWAAAGTRNGTSLWMQINHPGRQAPVVLNREAVAPSAVPLRKDLAPNFAKVRALREDEIHELIARYARTAAIAKKAGFSGVQIHGAHGYLVSQFLSSLVNQRNDDWGGNSEKRMRFVEEVYKAMRASCGPDFAIGIKLNSADFQRGGFSDEESMTVAQRMAELGMDLIEISGGTYEAPAMSRQAKSGTTTSGTATKTSTQQREAYFLDYCERIRARLPATTPLMLTGGFRTAAGMQAALDSGACDVVGMARTLAVQPAFSRDILAGKTVHSKVRPISTGIRKVDELAMMEVMWYSRQIARMGRGVDPKPDESGLYALLAVLLKTGTRTLNTRLRA